MTSNHDRAFEFMLKFEGYKSDDPDDAGGRTIYGISARSHPEVVAELWNLPKDMALEIAKEFYKVHYWHKIHGDILPDKIDIMLFDTAVNQGVSFANKIRREYSTAPHLDDINFEFIQNKLNPELYVLLVLHYLFIERLEKYNQIARLRNNIKYLRGWINRLIALDKELR